MILSQTCNYAIRAVVYIATRQPEEGFVSIRQISRDLDISFHFLTKILQKLTDAGMLVSSRGAKGGVRFARGAEIISLYEIVLAIDGPDLFQRCILGLDHCGDENPCPLHPYWAELRPRLEKLFRQFSIADLARGVADEIYRITNLEPQRKLRGKHS